MMMWKNWILFYLFMILCGNCSLVFASDRGLQVRFTQKALDYALNLEVNKLEENLRGKTFDQSGKSGRVEFKLSNVRITDVRFPSRSITPKPGVGLQVQVYGASISAEGKIWYKYKKGWVKISDSIRFTARTKNVNFQMVLGIGADANGRPTISSESCNGHVGDVDIDFHGGMAWIYNIFSGLAESKLKEKLNDAICQSAIRAVDNDLKPDLSTFPVVTKIDDLVLIDYKLMGAPLFTSNYFDIYIKGEFKDAKNPVESLLPFSSFETNEDASRMIYFWLSEYTANTAGEVYHKTGRFDIVQQGWDNKVSDVIKKLLTSKNLAIICPSIYKKYPNHQIGIHLKSYKAPQCGITKSGVRFFLYVRADLSVLDGKKIVPIFGMTLNVNTTVAVEMKDGNVIVQIKAGTLRYHAEVDPEYKAIVTISLNSPFISAMLKTMIMEKVNKKLKNGLPLPNLGSVSLKETSIRFEENAIRLASDITLKRWL